MLSSFHSDQPHLLGLSNRVTFVIKQMRKAENISLPFHQCLCEPPQHLLNLTVAKPETYTKLTRKHSFAILFRLFFHVPTEYFIITAPDHVQPHRSSWLISKSSWYSILQKANRNLPVCKPKDAHRTGQTWLEGSTVGFSSSGLGSSASLCPEKSSQT